VFWWFVPGMGRGRGWRPGRGRGFGFGPGFGRANPYPWCRFFPWLPRWWWAGYGGPFSAPAPFARWGRQPEAKQ